MSEIKDSSTDIIFNIGSFSIHQHDTMYSILPDNKYNHSMYNVLFQSFQSGLPDITQFISNKESIVPLSDMIYDTKSVDVTFNLTMSNVLLKCIYSQILFFLENNIAISFIDINDIMVINGTSFYFCNYRKLYHIKNRFITITDFYDLQNPFLPPELIDNNFIPFSTYYTSSFYSLAVLILYCLKKTNLGSGMEDKDRENEDRENEDRENEDREDNSSYQSLLNMYQHTKIYNTLKYCLVKEPKQRSLHMF